MKIKKIQVFRHLTQIISLFLLPGLYILAFDQLKTIYKMSIGGSFNFINIFPSLIEFSTVIFATILLGRFFCGWFCTFGAYNDLIYYLNKKIFKVKFEINPKIDAILKYTKYLVLVLIIAISWTIGSTILKSTSPWDAFAQITDISTVISTFAIGFILLILITVGSFFIERFFCRYLCPLGAIFTLISKISIFKINKPSSDCGKCRACTNSCSMSLPLYNVETVKGGECINCLKCVEVCPRNNAQANIIGQDVNPVLASSVALSAFVGVYALNNLGGTLLTNTGISSTTSISSSVSSSSENDTSTNTTKTNTSTQTTSTASTDNSNKTNSSVASSQIQYKDGTYTGTGTGYKRGTTKLSVTIKNNIITSIETISTQDTQRFYDNAKDKMFNEIISADSTSVDTVSGATFTSKGIISAVQSALDQAK